MYVSFGIAIGLSAGFVAWSRYLHQKGAARDGSA
jgi:hypothetical protein